MRTKENTLYLPIKQIYFDAILAGTKKQEYREIKDTTYKKYLETERVDGETRIMFYEDLISIEEFEKYPNYPLIYNGGVYPYAPREYEYLNLVVGYNKDRDTMLVKVVDITFEALKDDAGNDLRFDVDWKEDIGGDFAMWMVVYHLGEVVEKNLKKDRKSND